MDRISTLMSSQHLLSGVTQSQRSMYDAQNEVSTGKLVTQFSDDASSVSGLIAARSADAQTAAYQTVATAVQNQTDLQDTNMDQISTIVSNLKDTVLGAVANGSGTTVDSALQNAFNTLKGILNTQVDGRYIYGGTRQDVPPVTADSLTDLTALPSTSAAFQNSDTPASATVAPGETLAYGQLASDVATPVFDVLRQIASYASGTNGPLGATLTDAQSSFLNSTVASLTSAASSITTQQAQNGVNYSAAKTAVSNNSDVRDGLAGVISNIEDADMATAISKLNNAQTALQASAKAYTTIQSMSLLSYLPS